MEESFGAYVRKLRNDRGLTLTQLAARLDMDSANLSKIETGKREFDERKLLKLSEIFNLNADHIKEEYFSDQIARKLYKTSCSAKTLTLAEQKIRYYKQKGAKQGELNL
jgi:transcriptional regulator with XRE-family HTH domain